MPRSPGAVSRYCSARGESTEIVSGASAGPAVLPSKAVSRKGSAPSTAISAIRAIGTEPPGARVRARGPAPPLALNVVIAAPHESLSSLSHRLLVHAEQPALRVVSLLHFAV